MASILLLILAGYALMFGARNAAERFISGAIAVALAVSVLPGLFDRAFGALSLDRVDVPDVGGILLGSVAGLALALVGYFAWHARDSRRRHEDERARRDSAPRERDLPPPPPRADEGEGE